MVARVTRFRIRLGKVEEFATRAEALIAAMDKLAGFRVLLLLRGEEPDGRDATSISVWDSPEDLHNSENDELLRELLTDASARSAEKQIRDSIRTNKTDVVLAVAETESALRSAYDLVFLRCFGQMP
jgi:heme-degrading monooxygenase HmoA